MRRGFLLISSFLIVFLAACRDPDLDHAREFLQLEDWPRANASYDQCVQEAPQSAEARLGLAMARLGWVRERSQFGLDSLEEWLRVARDLAIVERLDSNQNTRGERADALYHGSLWLQSHSQSARAEAVARMAQNVDPDHAPSAQFLGNLARARNESIDAERWFSRALAADSGFLPAYMGLAEVAAAENDPEGAILYLQMGLRRDSTNEWFLTRVGALRESLGWKE
ncbi:MAG: tetratricopeptide repeat protein [Fibrobacteres bacterium]|nr:tetratricopeptide repeat protein [Fibrobacterota bacterium]